MRMVLAALAAAATVWWVAIASPAPAAGDALTGKMTAFNYLIGGTWSRSTHMSAMGDEPANSGQSTVTFDVTPGNTVHDHIETTRYAAWEDPSAIHNVSTHKKVSANKVTV